MTEKVMRERLEAARPAEVPIVAMYFVAAVFEGPPPPPPTIVIGCPGMTDLSNRADVPDGASITVTCYSPPARRKKRKKRKGK
jgi:hypothetical protein